MKNSKPSQCDRIIRYIADFGSITPMEAFVDLGITKLATRIGELKRKGYEFQQDYMTAHNRYGEKTRFMKYALKK